jgi:hypothetical protein
VDHKTALLGGYQAAFLGGALFAWIAAFAGALLLREAKPSDGSREPVRIH